MNKEVAGTIGDTRPPVIGNCPKCQAEILASHPYAWCVRCNEPLPYGINMQRRPIIYSSFSFRYMETSSPTDH
jgi:hypothetical protein